MLYRTALLILTLAAFGLRLYGLGQQSFWLDEVDAIAMARAPLSGQVARLTAIGENGPLYFLLFKGWLLLTGDTETGARALSCLASTAAVPLLAALARRLTGARLVALAAASLAAISPYYVWYGQDAKMYPLYALLALAAQYALLRAAGFQPWGASAGPARAATAGGGWPWWMAYVIAASLALYIHLFAALQIAANSIAGSVLVSRRGTSRRVRAGFALATAGLVLPYVPLAAWQAPVLLHGADVGYRPTPLPAMAMALGEQLTWHLNPAPDRRLLILLAVLLAWGLLHVYRRSATAAAVVCLWLVVPLVLVYALQFTVPVFRDRYLIPLVAPLLVLLAAAVVGPLAREGGVQRLGGASLALAPQAASRWAASWGAWMGAASAAFLGVSFAYSLAHRPPNPDFRAAARLVYDELRPGDRVGFLAEYAQRPFDFYYRQLPGAGGAGRYVKAPLPYTNFPGETEQAGLLAVSNSVQGPGRLWVVRFEDWLWDGRDLTTQYLRNRGAQRGYFRDLNGVSVSLWQLP